MSDAWGIEEGPLNKAGTGIAVGIPILAALFAWGAIPIDLSPALLFLIVSISGIVGGALNVAGRGPLWAGGVVGLLTSLGGFSAIYWWISGRPSVATYEIAIAFVIGAAPGFILQHFMPRLVAKPEQETQ